MNEPLFINCFQNNLNKINDVPIKIIWKDIDLKIKIKKGQIYTQKHVLNNISGYAQSGECLAILGNSGAGKSTLLNILSDRFKVENNMNLYKDVQVNNEQMTQNSFQQIVGFVIQSDIFLEYLSIKETLQYVIDLFYNHYTSYQKEQELKSIISNLKLETCQDNIVGGQIKGISGGQKRRLSIGQELMKRPRILFLDEPTSGLDSYTAFVIIALLRKLAKQKSMVIIYTIHQPSEAISQLFDRIMILNQGNLIFFDYFKNLKKCLKFLKLNLPNDTHLIEYIIDQTQIENMRIKIQQFYQEEKSGLQYTQNQIKKQINLKINKSINKAGMFQQISILYKRNCKNYIRNPKSFYLKFIQTIFISIILLLMYWNQENVSIDNPKSIQNRLGALFIISSNLYMMYFNTSLGIFIFEKTILSKEFNNGYYSIGSYYISKVLVELPIVSIFPIIFSCLIYYNLNFNRTILHFLYFTIGCIIETWLGTVMGILLACWVNKWERAIQIAPLIFVLIILYAGYTINLNNYLSPVKYTFEFLVLNEFKDKDDELGKISPIKTLNINLKLQQIILINISFLILYLILGYLALKYKLRKLQN